MMKNNTLTSGDSGRKIRIKTNIFPIKALTNAVCYQYDVSTVPEVPTEVCRKAFRQCERLIKNTNPDSWFVYDGVKSAYSMTSIGDTTFDVIVEKECAKETSSTGQSQQGFQVNKRGGRSFENKPDFAPAPDSVLQPVKILTESSAVGAHQKISVKISQVSQVDFHNLLLYAQGKSINSDSVTHACTALSAALRYVPSLLYVSIGSNFFSSHGCTDINGGLQVWRGYHQSVRVLMAGHLGINVDVASSVFRKGGITLIEYLYDVFGVRDVQDILRQPPDAINRMIKGVNVVTNHRGDQKQRFKISKLSRETAKSMKFEGRDKKMISVAEYFEKEYSIKLKYAHLPLVLKVDWG
jgi:eukaryotic translation initiation factor 2C